ncbi:Dabb family protein [Pandoraea sputorum]|uniref:Stress responsive alpha-beta barrel n=1 Tax=Pandoraea sputorum TaxID=93222 RepID=A0A5E5AT86_9BURK|nr:Dabb family protein [Pandoraea sputorum]VVE75815.1 stress responsive alpha-beta barrel [Pandoraea sputorum]
MLPFEARRGEAHDVWTFLRLGRSVSRNEQAVMWSAELYLHNNMNSEDRYMVEDATATMFPRQPAAQRLAEELQRVGVDRFVSPEYKPGRVRHIVLFRYKSTVTDVERANITHRFLALRNSLRNDSVYIASIETGIQNGGEQLDQGLDQAFLVTFRSEGDRNYYVGRPLVQDAQFFDPQHEAFKAFVAPFLAPSGVVVFDYSVVAQSE